MSIAVPCFSVSYGGAPEGGGVAPPGGGAPGGGCPEGAGGALFQYIAVAYKDGSVKLVDKQSFLPMTTTNLDTGITDLDNPEKRRKTVAYMTHMQQSFTGTRRLCDIMYYCFSFSIDCVVVIVVYVFLFCNLL